MHLKLGAMAFYLGIDAGGTHTDCAVSDGSAIYARASSGTSKIHKVGRDMASKHLSEAVNRALMAAGITGREVRGACVGIAGASDPTVVGWVKETLGSFMTGKVNVVGDNEIAHHAAFRGGAGVLVISGTGSIAYGRSANGSNARAGGWGPVISDEGSGTWIGRGAIARVMRAHDDGRETAMRDKILARWKLNDLTDLVREANKLPNPDFSELVPCVLDAAREGDAVAEDLLGRAGVELAALAAAVAGKLFRNGEAVTVCGIGGVLTNSAIVRGVLGRTVAELRAGARFDEREVDPILGAVALAAKA